MERRGKRLEGRCRMEAPDMGAAKMGGPGLDKDGARRGRRRRCGPDRGGKSLRRAWQADHEGEALRQGKSSGRSVPYTVGKQERKSGAGHKEHKAYGFSATVPSLYRSESDEENQSTRLWWFKFVLNRQQQRQENGAEEKTNKTAYGGCEKGL
eukprot:2111857-Heterocapsa_arctica.AAC.1